MDTTELHYVDYNEESTWDEMMRTYISEGGDILYPGDEKEILLRAVLAMTTAIMAKVDSALRMDTLTYATGEYLKEYGLKRNCVYHEAVAATAPVQITFGASGVSQTIPAGTELTEDGVMIYALTEDVEQTGAAQVVNTTVICTTAGAVGNGLLQGAQLQFLNNNAAVLSAVATADASGGIDAEDEEIYRERIRNYGLSTVTTGPQQMYESRAMAASSEIIDARALNDGDGEVGVYLILAEGASQQSVFAKVEEALSARTVRPLTDHVEVHAAGEVTYTLNVKVWYSQYAGIGDAVTAAVAEYKAWQDNHIGRAFNPDKLLAMLYQTGCDRVQFLDGSAFDGGDVEYTEIDPDERCKGTINLTVVTT